MKILLSTLLCTSLIACGGSRSPGGSEYGEASFYANSYQGRLTANGERYNGSGWTAAHKSLAFGTLVRVTNIDNGKSVVVRINDRGPFVRGRVIDLTRTAFSEIADLRQGVVDVSVQVLR